MFIRIMVVGFGIWCLFLCSSTLYLYLTDPVFTNMSGGMGGPVIIILSTLGIFVSFMAFRENERFM